jgi:hypothetical protein
MTSAPRLKGLRPSAAARWLACPGYALVAHAASAIPEPIAEEVDLGTRAHAVLHWIGGQAPVEGIWDVDLHGPRPTGDPSGWLPSDQYNDLIDIWDNISDYAVLGGFVIRQEVPLTLPFDAGYTMPMTSDIVMVSDTDLVVIDYKHGAGKYVQVRGNPQIGLYAAAARRVYPGRRISGCIIQPRVAQSDGEVIHFAHLSSDYLDNLEKCANAAIIRAHNPMPDFTPGPHCQMCPGLRGFCPAMIRRLLELAAIRADGGDGIIGTMPWWILDADKWLPQLVERIRDTALSTIESGGTVPGWTIEEKPGRSEWVDKMLTPDLLMGRLGVERDVVMKKHETVSVITITDATKLAKSKKVDILDLINKPKRRVLVQDNRTGSKQTAFSAVTTESE